MKDRVEIIARTERRRKFSDAEKTAILAEAGQYRQLAVQAPTPQAHAARPDASEEPQHAVLACKKILHTFGIKPRAWRAGLPPLLDRFYRHG